MDTNAPISQPPDGEGGGSGVVAVIRRVEMFPAGEIKCECQCLGLKRVCRAALLLPRHAGSILWSLAANLSGAESAAEKKRGAARTSVAVASRRRMRRLVVKPRK